MSNHPRLQHLVIKPTLACTAGCVSCVYRKQLHKKRIKEKQLSFDDWKNILSQARNLGAWHLTISGGEPTLYKQLPDLIRLGKQLGFLVRLNTNGSLINEAYAEKLLQAGLDVVDVSLYSSIASVHNEIRRSKNLWKKATTGIKIFAGLKSKYPKFKVITQTILCHENYTEFAELLHLHRDLGSSGLLVSYLEGDFEKQHLFNQDEIEYFRNKILPKAIKVCKELDPYVKDTAVFNLKRLFSQNILSDSNWAQGIYRPESKPCRIPYEQALMLANGEVHPCNIVEYTHEPVMGNLFENSLGEIWQGDRWHHFRQHFHDKCELCPMNHHVFIPLRPGNQLIAMTKFWIQKIIPNHLKALRLEALVYSLLWKARIRTLQVFPKIKFRDFPKNNIPKM